MSYANVKEAIDAGQGIVVGVVVIAVTLAIGLYIVTQLNTTSNGALGVAVQLINNVISPIQGGLNFLGLAFLVIVAVIIIKVLQTVRGAE